MINIEEASNRVGDGVVYVRPFCDREDGVITSVGELYVFVRYSDQHPGASGKAADPADLEWLAS